VIQKDDLMFDRGAGSVIIAGSQEIEQSAPEDCKRQCAAGNADLAASFSSYLVLGQYGKAIVDR
jgi:hypothetical protein